MNKYFTGFKGNGDETSKQIEEVFSEADQKIAKITERLGDNKDLGACVSAADEIGRIVDQAGARVQLIFACEESSH